MFQTIFHHQEFCTSSLQYFTVHLYEEYSRWPDTIDQYKSYRVRDCTPHKDGR